MHDKPSQNSKLTKYTETAVNIGTAEQIRATVRHGINVLSTKMVSIPIEAQMNV